MNKYKLLRVTADLTQDELANLLEVSRKTVILWESGKVDPSLSHIRRMCLLYNVSADYLLDIKIDEEEINRDKKR